MEQIVEHLEVASITSRKPPGHHGLTWIGHGSILPCRHDPASPDAGSKGCRSDRSVGSVIRRLGRDAEQLDALRRLKPVPEALRHDHEVARLEGC